MEEKLAKFLKWILNVARANVTNRKSNRRKTVNSIACKELAFLIGEAPRADVATQCWQIGGPILS